MSVFISLPTSMFLIAIAVLRKLLFDIGIKMTVSFVILCFCLQLYFFIKRDNNAIGFFHPCCMAMGGGERVLWSIIKATLDQTDKFGTIIYVYADARNLDTQKILYDVESYFNINLTKKNYKQTYHEDQQLYEISSRLIFIPLKSAWLLDADCYPACRILLQSLSSMIVALEGLIRATPIIYVETVGWIFTSFIAWGLARCTCHAYTHYPLIVPHMLEHRLDQSRLKCLYYRVIGVMYRSAGTFFESFTVNSSWTLQHIKDLMVEPPAYDSDSPLKKADSRKQKYYIHVSSSRLFLMYPPCDLAAFKDSKKGWDQRHNWVVSVGQFRPEKNHVMQLQIIHHIFSIVKEQETKQRQHVVPQNLRFIIAGGVRDVQDQALVNYLKQECIRLEIASYVDFETQIDHDKLRSLLQISKVKYRHKEECSLKHVNDKIKIPLVMHSTKKKATILSPSGAVGLHTMKDEHFGIALIEMLAAGLVVVAHDSGGPANDILTDARQNVRSPQDISPEAFTKYRVSNYGYLATTVEEFVEAILSCFNPKCAKTTQNMLKRAKASTERFSTCETFGSKYVDSLDIFRIFKAKDVVTLQRKKT